MLAKKPKLTAEQQIKHLVEKGIKFTIITEAEALKYLSDNNNFFKLTAYRKNFKKHPGGPGKGKYIDLEFAQLQDMAVVDMRLRYLLMHMALDIEHFTKVNILNKIEAEASEDGYSVVADYRSSLNPDGRARLDAEIGRNQNNSYSGGIIDKYNGSYPVWAFIEIIPFGRLIHFCKFCAERLGDRQMLKHHFLLLPVRLVRNAVAHNSCILNDLWSSNSDQGVDRQVAASLGLVPNISKQTRSRKMANIRIRQVVTLLFVHKSIVTSEGVRENRYQELHRFKQRMLRNLRHYENNSMLLSAFEFIQKVIDNWFPTSVK